MIRFVGRTLYIGVAVLPKLIPYKNYYHLLSYFVFDNFSCYYFFILPNTKYLTRLGNCGDNSNLSQINVFKILSVLTIGGIVFVVDMDTLCQV